MDVYINIMNCLELGQKSKHRCHCYLFLLCAPCAQHKGNFIQCSRPAFILIATCHVKPGKNISPVASGRHTEIHFDVLIKVPSMGGEQGEAEWGGRELEEEGSITDLRAV